MSFLGDLGLQFAGGAINSLSSLFSSGQAFKRQKELMDYQMKLQDEQFSKYYSPQAQVSNLAAAGINPAVAMGNQSPVFSSGPSSVSPGSVVPAQFGIGTTSLTDLAQYLLGKAEAKKAGVETKNIDVDTEAKKFEFELSKWFSAPEKLANITLAWKNVMLKDDEHNINEWKKATEEALSQLKGIERDSAKKLFENMDTVIQQENKQREESIKLTQEQQKTEGTQQTANRAAARVSNTQANVNEQETRLRSALADIEESGSTFKLESLLRSYDRQNAISAADKKEAELKLQRLKDLENKRDSSLFREIDSMLEWLKNKVSIFH